MWSEAIAMLERADRMRDQFVRPVVATAQVAWEPSVDVLETERVVLVLVALAGVAARIEGDDLVVSRTRVYPPAPGSVWTMPADG